MRGRKKEVATNFQYICGVARQQQQKGLKMASKYIRIKVTIETKCKLS